MSEHTNKQFDAEMEGIRSGVLSMGGIVEQQVTRAIEALEKDDDARRTVESARETLKRASAGAGDNFDFLFSLANLQLQLAELCRETAQLEQAFAGLAEAHETIDKLQQLAPDVGEVALMGAT